MKQIEVSRATMGRIPMYLKYLKSAIHSGDNISATTIAKQLGLGEVQVRKDLSAVSGAGRPKTGYNIGELIASLENFLNDGKIRKVVLIGAGKIGRALLDYKGFEDYGLEIAAAFDTAVKEVEYSKSGKPVLPSDELDGFCAENEAKIGIIAVPSENAQEVCDRLIKNGILAIWCFAPCTLNVPENIEVRYENMALSLAYLSKKI